MRQRSGIAGEGTIADIVVFQLSTVTIDVALAIDGVAGALTILANVAHSADIPVVTLGGVVGKNAAPGCIAGIVGTGVVVVAQGRRPDTLPSLAVVGYGARVSIKALAGIEGLVLAAVGAQAVVRGARVIVVAGILIHIPIAVIVETVADLLAGDDGVARRQSFFRTVSLASANTEVVGLVTRRGEGECDGLAGTWTDPRIGHAL